MKDIGPIRDAANGAQERQATESKYQDSPQRISAISPEASPAMAL